MPGGSPAAWEHVEKIFTDIAAKVGKGEPCCRYLGPDGAGHFVKMVHNGIEYADMQLIAETYTIMRDLFGMEAREIKEVFAEWSEGISVHILLRLPGIFWARRIRIQGSR